MLEYIKKFAGFGRYTYTAPIEVEYGDVYPAQVVSPHTKPLDLSTRDDVRLGDIVREKVTNFEGVVTCLSHEMDGTIFVGIQPPNLKDGVPADAYDFDIERVLVIKRGNAKLNMEGVAEKDAVKLGAQYRDRVSGFVGTCVARIDFLAGCTRISLAGKVDKDNKRPENVMIPVERAELIDVTPAKVAEKTQTRTGGPGKSDEKMMKRMLARA